MKNKARLFILLALAPIIIGLAGFDSTRMPDIADIVGASMARGSTDLAHAARLRVRWPVRLRVRWPVRPPLL